MLRTSIGSAWEASSNDKIQKVPRKRKTFSSSGVLEGMGRQAPCVVMGTREWNADHEPKLIRLSIAQEPQHMLDGPYTVRFGGESAQVERTGGLWLMAGHLRARKEPNR